MFISGLQKMTLLDYPGLVACTIFTGGCNFKCPFCHNASLVLPERLKHPCNNEEAVLSFLKKRQGLLDGVAITGGEPLLHADIPDFLYKIKSLGFKIKIDTNGSFPDRLRTIVEAGLVDRVAMDIKNSPALYSKTVGVDSLDLTNITTSKDYLLSNVVEYEFRTTVVRGLHTMDSLIEAAHWIDGTQSYFIQQFKNSGDLILPDNLEAFSDNEMREIVETIRLIIPNVQLRGVL